MSVENESTSQEAPPSAEAPEGALAGRPVEDGSLEDPEETLAEEQAEGLSEKPDTKTEKPLTYGEEYMSLVVQFREQVRNARKDPDQITFFNLLAGMNRDMHRVLNSDNLLIVHSSFDPKIAKDKMVDTLNRIVEGFEQIKKFIGEQEFSVLARRCAGLPFARKLVKDLPNLNTKEAREYFEAQGGMDKLVKLYELHKVCVNFYNPPVNDER